MSKIVGTYYGMDFSLDQKQSGILETGYWLTFESASATQRKLTKDQIAEGNKVLDRVLELACKHNLEIRGIHEQNMDFKLHAKIDDPLGKPTFTQSEIEPITALHWRKKIPFFGKQHVLVTNDELELPKVEELVQEALSYYYKRPRCYTVGDVESFSDHARNKENRYKRHQESPLNITVSISHRDAANVQVLVETEIGDGIERDVEGNYSAGSRGQYRRTEQDNIKAHDAKEHLNSVQEYILNNIKQYNQQHPENPINGTAKFDESRGYLVWELKGGQYKHAEEIHSWACSLLSVLQKNYVERLKKGVSPSS